MWGLPCWRRRWTSEEREEGKPSLAPPPLFFLDPLGVFFPPPSLLLCFFPSKCSFFLFSAGCFFTSGRQRDRERGREREREKEREGEREGEGGRGSVRVCVCVERSRVREATKKIGERGLVLRWRADVRPRPLVEKKRSSRRRLQARHTSLDSRLSRLWKTPALPLQSSALSPFKSSPSCVFPTLSLPTMRSAIVARAAVAPAAASAMRSRRAASIAASRSVAAPRSVVALAAKKGSKKSSAASSSGSSSNSSDGEPHFRGLLKEGETRLSKKR